jgi:tRNA(Ile)-lysidine synthase
MTVRTIAPISAAEFTHMMQLVGTWSKNLCRWVSIKRVENAKNLETGVANSGGSDSTCLLFLLNRYIKKEFKSRRLISLTIDHDLQPTSAQMAEHAAKFAESLGVKHVTTKISWGEGIYPEKPTSNTKLEHLARDARYAALFTAMQDAQSYTLALGHHIDDQVETMLMRLGRGTTKLGMIGMQRRSRWGMGDNSGALTWRGHDGVRTHKIRPLLDVGKVSLKTHSDWNHR